eukprot:365051-Chlamydomonas_euryale.AAC.12
MAAAAGAFTSVAHASVPHASATYACAMSATHPTMACAVPDKGAQRSCREAELQVGLDVWEHLQSRLRTWLREASE